MLGLRRNPDNGFGLSSRMYEPMDQAMYEAVYDGEGVAQRCRAMLADSGRGCWGPSVHTYGVLKFSW